MASNTSTPPSWGGQRLSPRSAINVVTTPSHWITDLNVRVDAATREPPEIDLTWLLRRPYSFIPPVPFRDQCQLSPTALSYWLQDRASIPAQAIYEARWGVNFMPGGGLPLDWFDHDQQRHITAHRMDNVPTMAVLAQRSSHRGTVLDTTCLLCGTQPGTAPHLWACSAQSHEWGPARRRLAAWLDQKVGPQAAPVRHQLCKPTVLEQWAAALRTPSMQLAPLECKGRHLLGTEFLCHVVEESIRIWYAHAKARATLLKARLGPAARWRGRCRSYARTSKQKGKGCSGSSWNKRGRERRTHQVSLTPPPPAEAYTLTHSAHTTHTAQPVYLYPWVDIPAFCLLVTAPSVQHNTTGRNATRHNKTQHNTALSCGGPHTSGARPNTRGATHRHHTQHNAK